ncbi:hypothetical protein RHMOL_Rhmol06G0099000 [Rhododendron molle]|uniref:Uncharacterized protein n=1 Tax=Rhododendron molle TaxID=49168 RepID=A0ACC0NC99_RHOML|nr:hypothetical protein RHMOL_Rhmol06G0099000 [Rhododendron molle]
MNSYFLVLALIQLSLVNTCFGARKLTSLYNPAQMAVTYHNGALLEGDLHLSIHWIRRANPGSNGEDVGVEGFYLSYGFHGSDAQKKSVFIWVDNLSTQCPGRCAWPFH